MNKWLNTVLWVGFAVFSMVAYPVHAASTGLHGVRLWTAPDHTRVVIDLEDGVDYRLFTLDDPNRVVIDIQQADWANGHRPHVAASGYVKNLRSARQKDDSLRLVLDMDRKVSPKSFLLKPNERYGHRLVVDLYQQQKGPARAVKSTRVSSNDGFREVVVAIDAGHGGEDPGASGRNGTQEKVITLAVARKLAHLINRQKGMKAVLIRDGDYYMGLRKRIDMAREERADIFLSLHADAFNSPKVKGSSVYILSDRGASSEAARWLAQKENAADLMGGISMDDKDDLLKSVLYDLSQTATIEASADLAQNTISQLGKVGKVHRRHVERAGFAVLKSPDIPSMLVELAFISNPHEESKLRDSKHQQEMAQAIMSGVKRFLHQRPPDGSLFASLARSRTHTIKRGDTLSELAKRYQISLNELKAANDLSSNMLKVGQVLRIPPQGS